MSARNDTAGIQGLTPGATYYTYVLPYDTFGPGIPTFTESFVPFGFDLTLLEKDPPGVPQGLRLTTGSDVSADGTIVPWVEARWNANPEDDLRGYQLSFRIEPSNGGAPTVVHAAKGDTSYRMNVPGALTIFCKIAAEDRLSNISPYSPEVQITSGRDTVAPGPCSNLTIVGSTQKVHLLWTPSINAPDYAYAEVFASATNNLANGGLVGQGQFSYEHAGFTANQTVYFWVRAVDSSGNKSTFHPASPTGGVPGTAGQLDTTYISSLAADKIIAGTITALVKIGVSGLIDINGPSQVISIKESQTGNVRVLMGRLGSLGTDWGLLVLDAEGRIMFDARDSGVTAFGIKTGAIQAGHLTVHNAVVTAGIQIATAIIDDTHVNTLSANKITAGTVSAPVFWGTAANGVGTHVVIDGLNHNIVIYDDADQLRVVMGSFAGTYGFFAFAPDGTTMWDSINGATNRGIGDNTITTVKVVNETITTIKVADNAITNSVQYVDDLTLSVTTSETAAASLVFDLNTNDQVLMWAMGTGSNSGTSLLTIRIKLDSVGGAEIAYGQYGGAGRSTIATQAVYTHTGAPAVRAFVFTLQNGAGGSGDAVALDHRKFIGIRRQK